MDIVVKYHQKNNKNTNSPFIILIRSIFNCNTCLKEGSNDIGLCCNEATLFDPHMHMPMKKTAPRNNIESVILFLINNKIVLAALNFVNLYKDRTKYTLSQNVKRHKTSQSKVQFRYKFSKDRLFFRLFWRLQGPRTFSLILMP